MGEKFDTPTGVAGPFGGMVGDSQTLTVDTSLPGESATTQEKPGTGSKTLDEDKQNRPSSWSGGDKYPDGFEMTRHPDGSITLTDPSGEMAVWENGQWVDWRSGGGPMPPEWSGGHEPGKG